VFLSNLSTANLAWLILGLLVSGIVLHKVAYRIRDSWLKLWINLISLVAILGCYVILYYAITR
jgi:hypothetical protein